MRCYTMSYGLMREISQADLTRVQMNDLILDQNLPEKFTHVNIDRNYPTGARISLAQSEDNHPEGHVLVLFIECRRELDSGFYSDYTYELPPLKQIISRGISANKERAVLAILRPGDNVCEYADSRHAMDIQIAPEHGHLVKRFLPGPAFGSNR